MIPFQYRDIESGEAYPGDSALYLSPEGEEQTKPGGVLRGVLEIEYDFEPFRGHITPETFVQTGIMAMQHGLHSGTRTPLTDTQEQRLKKIHKFEMPRPPYSAFSTRRYSALFPLKEPGQSFPPLHTGGTPMILSRPLCWRHGFTQLLFKDEGRNPSGSYKDRASELVVARAIEAEVKTIVAASTGNAASALALQAAASGVRAVVFVPAKAPEGKLVQMLAAGAEIIRIDGTYDQCYDLSIAVSKEKGWMNRNTAYNPFTTDGKRTGAFEIAEQYGWDVPDIVAVSVGDGDIISGLAKGFRDLWELGIIAREPRLLGVQASGSDPIVRAIEQGLDMPPVIEGASSMADSIVAEAPRNGMMAVRDIRRTGGAAVRVSEEAIAEAHEELAGFAGLFIEPSSAATWAGVKEAADKGIIRKDQKICAVLTGTGLKDTAAVLRRTQLPDPVPAKLDTILNHLPG